MDELLCRRLKRRALPALLITSAFSLFGACPKAAPPPATSQSLLPGLRVQGPVLYRGRYEISFSGVRASVKAHILLPDGEERALTWSAEGRKVGVTGVLFDGRALFPVPPRLETDAPAALEITAYPPPHRRVSTSLPRQGAEDSFFASSLGELTASLWVVGAENELSALDGAVLAVLIDTPPEIESALLSLADELSRSLGPPPAPTLFVLQGKGEGPQGAYSPGRDWKIFFSGEGGALRLSRAMVTAWLGPATPETLVDYYSALLLFRASLLPPEALPDFLGPDLPRAQLRLFCYDAHLRQASPPRTLEGLMQKAREENSPLKDALARESFSRACDKKPWQRGAPAAGLSPAKKGRPKIQDPAALRRFLTPPESP